MSATARLRGAARVPQALPRLRLHRLQAHQPRAPLQAPHGRRRLRRATATTSTTSRSTRTSSSSSSTRSSSTSRVLPRPGRLGASARGGAARAAASAGRDEPLRVWSAGCASGQEAYTAAMVLAELLGTDAFRERVKIYATDIDEDALGHRAAAVYTRRRSSRVPEELRERYFERADQRFAFRKDLRRTVIFGRNNLVQDAPISRLDLLICRNTLMYFNAETQARILRHFHFALRDDGVLMLGKSEMMLSHRDAVRADGPQAADLPQGRAKRSACSAASPADGSAPSAPGASPRTTAQPRRRARDRPARPGHRVPDRPADVREPACARALPASASRTSGARSRTSRSRTSPVELRGTVDEALRERRRGDGGRGLASAPERRRRAQAGHHGHAAAVGRQRRARRGDRVRGRHAATPRCSASWRAIGATSSSPTRSCSRRSTSSRRPTRSCSRPTRSCRPPTRSSSRPTRSSRR